MQADKIAQSSDFKKEASASIKNAGLSLTQWEQIHGKQAFGFKSAGLKKVADAQTRYLLSHSTIMSSVATEPGPEPWLIVPEASHMVNNNSDSWTNPVLLLSYPTFRGAFNFNEHFQSSKHNKGHILDAVIRKVWLNDSVWVYFVDLLVATDKSHEELCGGILQGKIRYMSMGCITDLITCSYCGKQIKEGDRYCHHLQFQKGQFIPDKDGIPRIVSEECGHESLPGGGVKFVEASFVATPAFPGAAVRNIINEDWLGPKTKYTSEAKKANKVASCNQKESDLNDQTKADFDRKFK